MQCIPKSLRIAKFYLNCAISYNLHFEIMQCIPKSINPLGKPVHQVPEPCCADIDQFDYNFLLEK